MRGLYLHFIHVILVVQAWHFGDDRFVRIRQLYFMQYRMHIRKSYHDKIGRIVRMAYKSLRRCVWERVYVRVRDPICLDRFVGKNKNLADSVDGGLFVHKLPELH